VISGLGCIPRYLEIFIRLDKKNTSRFEVVNHPEMFDGVRVKKGQAVAVIRAMHAPSWPANASSST